MLFLFLLIYVDLFIIITLSLYNMDIMGYTNPDVHISNFCVIQ